MSFECSVRASNDDDGDDNLLCAVDHPPLNMPTKSVRHRAILECNTTIGVGKRSREDRPIPTKSCWAPAALKDVKNKMVVGGEIKWKDNARLAVHAKPFNPENDGKNISFSNADAVDPLLDRLAALYEEGDPVPDDEENIVLDRDAWNRIITVKDSPSTTWAMAPLRELLKLYYESRGESLIFEQLRERMDREETLTEEDNVGLGSYHVPSSEDLGNYLLHFVAIDKEQLLLALNAARSIPTLQTYLKGAMRRGNGTRLDYGETREAVFMGHRALDPTLFPINSNPFSLLQRDGGITNNNIQELVNEWCLLDVRQKPPSEDPNHISKWNVSSVTSMNSLFKGKRSFNDDISEWNVSKVTNMSAMFHNANAFNQDISNWEVSKVTNMDNMFAFAKNFNQPIGKWKEKTKNVTSMCSMFLKTKAFNQDIGGWNVSNVTDMVMMFSYTEAFNQNIGGWDVSKVTDMYGIFARAEAFDQDLNNWKISRLINHENMFWNATAFIKNNRKRPTYAKK